MEKSSCKCLKLGLVPFLRGLKSPNLFYIFHYGEKEETEGTQDYFSFKTSTAQEARI